MVSVAGLGGFGLRQYARKPIDEERGPALVFSDPTQSIFLADMSGDGLTDIVRIRNGEVCYWPNLGYGRFGAKVTMDGSPWFDTSDQFDARRVRLGDIDGSGTTDILYLGSDNVAIYFNQSGNSLAGNSYCPTAFQLQTISPQLVSWICSAVVLPVWFGRRRSPLTVGGKCSMWT